MIKDFLYMPAGTHTIEVSWRSRRLKITIRVDEETASNAQNSFEKFAERNPKRAPVIGNYSETEIYLFPLAFFWNKDGVHVNAEFAKGKTMKDLHGLFLSPTFLSDAEFPKHGHQIKSGAIGSEKNPAKLISIASDFCGCISSQKSSFLL